MARCEITSFSIGQLALITNKSNKTPMPATPDVISGYTVTECALVKEMLSPHEFTFTLRRDTIKKSDEFRRYDIVSNILGQKVKCEVTAKPDANTTSKLVFNGVIDKVSMKGLNLICVAHSPDADLQGTPRCRCFTNVKLEDVVKAVIPNTLPKKINIHSYAKNVVFPYIVQYNESDYDFLVRLAKRFGSFMYFNNNLVFGRIPTLPNQSIFQRDIKNYCYSASYELQTSDPNFKFEAYHYEDDLELKTTGTEYSTFSPEKLVKKATDNSTPFEANPDYCIDDPHSHPNDSEFWEDDHSVITMCGDLSNLATCTFTTYLVNLDVGNVVTINDNGPMLITSLNLTWDCDGTLSNEVTAKLLPHDNMDSDDVYPPYIDFNAYPKSSAQRAVVINNVDPKKMGRVQVQFVWQKVTSDDEKKKLPWLRIAQPYGGNQKGCYILPEIGEEVMVGFEHDNMEKPFVIGTLYHDSQDDQRKQMPENAWCEVNNDHDPKVNVGNEVKAFRTKKGHTIEFHDVNGDQNYGFIRIYNKNKPNDPNYEIVLSTDPIQKPNGNQKENYKTTSAKVKDIQARNDIGEDNSYDVGKLRLMVRSYGGDIMLDAGAGDIIMNAANIRVHATGDVTTLIDQKNVMKVKGEQFVDVKDNSLVVQGKQDILVKGDHSLEVQKKQNIVVKGDQTVNVDSNSLEVQKNQNIVVKGEDSEEYQGKVSITAKKEVDIKGESKVDIKVDQAVKFKAQSLASQTDQKTEIKASDFAAEATQSAKVKANTGLNLDGGSKADLNASHVNVEGQMTATLKAARATLDGNTNAVVKGLSVEIDASATGTRKGTWTDM